MTYLQVPGRWLCEALLASKPAKESKERFLKRCARRLQKVARLDALTIRHILFGGEPDSRSEIPLFVVAILAREVNKTVRYLLIGSDTVDDPNLVSRVEDDEIESAEAFALLIDKYDLPFPSLLWEHGFPAFRKGAVGRITLGQWEELYRERYGAEPRPRVI